jgi:hypothetical protein
MGDVSWRGGSQEIVRHMTTAWLKIQGACSLCNMIETFCQRKIIKTKRGGPFGLFKLQMVLTQLFKNTFAYLCRHSNVNCNSSILCLKPHCKQQIFEWYKIEVLRQGFTFMFIPHN